MDAMKVMPARGAGGGLRRKVVSAETKTLDGHRVQAILSTESVDRDGDIIRAAGWDLSNFMGHPVLLSSHDYYSLRSQIGEWEDVSVAGKQLVGVARYYVGEGNDEADWGYKLAARGRAAYSVGFIPDMSKAKEMKNPAGFWPSYEFNGQELLECSHVTVPSNPDALQRMKGAGLALHPAVAEIVDDLLRDAPAAEVRALRAVSASAEDLDGLADALWERLKGRIGAAGPPVVATPSTPGPAAAAAAVDYRALAREAIADAVKELRLW